MMSYASVSAGLCRVCLRHAPRAVVPLLSESQHTPIAAALCRLAPAVHISSTDMLPKQICMECVIQVVRSERFRQKAETTHAKLVAIASTAEPGDVHEDIVTYSMYKHYFPDEQPALVTKHSKPHIKADISSVSKGLQSEHRGPNSWSDCTSQMDERSEDMIPTDYIPDEQPAIIRVPRKSTTQARVIDESSNPKGLHPEYHGKNLSPYNSSHTDERSQDMIPTEPPATIVFQKQDVKKIATSKIPHVSHAKRLRGKAERAQSRGHTVPARDTNVGGLPTQRYALVTCRVCDKRLLRLSYRAHLKRHNAPEFVCEQCGADFYTRGELASHLAFTHGTGRGLVCDHCGKVFRTKQILREHLFRHSGVRPYSCPHCSRTFYNKQVSVNHAKRHSATRNYKCDRCPRAFFTSAELWSHSNSMHERRHFYRCTHCPTTYAKIATVRAHLTAAHGVERDQQGPLARVPPPPAPPNQQP